MNSFIEVSYIFQALQKYSLQGFNSALISLLPRNYKHQVFLGYFDTARMPKKLYCGSLYAISICNIFQNISLIANGKS